MKNWNAVPPNGTYRRTDITGTFWGLAPRYPADARAGAAPDQLGMEAVAIYAACTRRDVSPNAASGCPASPSAKAEKYHLHGGLGDRPHGGFLVATRTKTSV